MLSAAQRLLFGRAGEERGSGALRDDNLYFPISYLHPDGAVRRRLGGPHPFDTLHGLGVDEEMPVAGTLQGRADAGEGLVEPEADAVIAVVHTAAVLLAGAATVPRLPRGCKLRIEN